MVAVIDYGVGNLFSLCSSLSSIGADVTVTSDVNKICSADKLILPGVGAFADAAAKLGDSGLDEILIKRAAAGVDIMGICLGMQLLFDESHEYGVHRGLGLLRGKVIPIKGDVPEDYKIPHIGWNALHFQRESDLFRYINENDCVYFVHSYYAAECSDSVIATAEYGRELTAAVQKDNVMGCQFHPEKSGKVGLDILRAFCERK